MIQTTLATFPALAFFQSGINDCDDCQSVEVRLSARSGFNIRHSFHQREHKSFSFSLLGSRSLPGATERGARPNGPAAFATYLIHFL